MLALLGALPDLLTAQHLCFFAMLGHRPVYRLFYAHLGVLRQNAKKPTGWDPAGELKPSPFLLEAIFRLLLYLSGRISAHFGRFAHKSAYFGRLPIVPRSSVTRRIQLREALAGERVGSRYVSGRTRAWLKVKNPALERH